MNFKDTVKHMMFNYPSIFPTPLAACRQLFFTVGNGMEWVKGELVNTMRYPGEKNSTTMLYDDIDDNIKHYKEMDYIVSKRYILEEELRRLNRKFIEEHIDEFISDNCMINLTDRSSTCNGHYELNIGDYAKVLCVPNNVKKDWGQAALDAIDWAFVNLNMVYGVANQKPYDRHWPDSAKQTHSNLMKARDKIRNIMKLPTQQQLDDIADKIITEVLNEEKLEKENAKA